MIAALFALLPALALPLDCQPGRTCWIQKYVDVDPGPGRTDYRCGPVTTDGHDGVDFRIPGLTAMMQGVPVTAVAAGTVLRIRDGVADRPVGVGGPSVATAQAAGNAVIIDHGDGWESQYSHLRRGSVSVRPGDTVRAGDAIGLVGLSGETEYPHLHFALRHHGRPVDPFAGTPAPAACGTGPARPLWTGAVLAGFRYVRGQPVRFVLTTAPAQPPLIDDAPPPSRTAPLVGLAELIGPDPGQEVLLELIGPGDRLLARRTVRPDRPYLVWATHLGLRAPAGGWPPGRYRARLSVRAGDAILSRMEVAALLR
ncbi:peptidoglycan DD-metalloendopeptidase family protein [Sphingomonas changnyeongensis]|uniref:Peptidoglycan DD-metalloendopeptidase family protein n=1 Tax=Sphingomonas changnyeongensis TaxID=2698679 RepID=A0A7Z2S8B9_9SPHN|nr:M23 family metallopeptidase [Sphingomonas changnyeongensis]QHL90492.1 peptidoglycan DD-metalloendopeptidase family protein [Sphingomonas changnyeongensis]